MRQPHRTVVRWLRLLVVLWLACGTMAVMAAPPAARPSTRPAAKPAVPPADEASRPGSGPTRAEALQLLFDERAPERAAAVARLGEVGTMADSAALATRLHDDDDGVRQLAGAALWLVWSRSGDAAIDRLLAQGVEQMSDGRLRAALATFNRVVQRRPAFAEGWNKRATVRFLLGEHAASLKDCERTLKLNPLHFGALSGMTQIHLARGDVDAALQAWRRALAANPNLDDGAERLEQLEDAVRRQGGLRT